MYGLGFLLGFALPGGRDLTAAANPWFWAAVVAALAAWYWRASGTAYLKRDVVFAADAQMDALVVAGPFRFVRNPLYLGNVFLALAVGSLAPPIGFAIVVLGNVVVGALLAAEESRLMAERYGPVYEAFCATVPAFVPRLTPATVAGATAVDPAWRAALLGESYCLVVAVALAPVALFGRHGLTAFWAILAPALVAYAFAGWLAGRVRAQRP